LAGDAITAQHTLYQRFGHVVAPRVITASDLTLTGIPAYAIWGSPVELHLALGPDHADQTAEELEVSLGRLSDVLQIEATYSVGDAAANTLVASIIA